MGRRRCPVCSSKQWHKEPSGLIACSEGHVLQNYRNETTELDATFSYNTHKRALKSDRKKKEEASRANKDLYRGERARFLYFQCQQFILRKQIVALIELWKLPAQFEIVCRDIWALHLSLLPNPPPSDLDDEVEPKVALLGKDGTNSRRRDSPSSPTPSSSSSSSSSSEDEPDTDHPGDEFSTALHSTGSDSSLSTSSQPKPNSSAESPRKEKKGRSRIYAYEGPASTVAVLALACWTMRLPILYRDFVRIIESYELPYLDPVRLLPRDLTKHLTGQNTQALSPDHAPSTFTLHALTSRLARQVYSTYGITTPDANAAPILWRVVKCLGGTPTLYALTKRLLHTLDVPLTPHNVMARPLKRERKKDPTRYHFDNIAPEVGFACAAVIVLKMVYGFDGEMRLPKEGGDPASGLPKVEGYLAYLREMDDAEMKNAETLFNASKSVSMGTLSDGMVDDYLDFCETALLSAPEADDAETRRGRGVLGKFFSLGGSGEGRRTKTGKITRADLSATAIDDVGEKLRPGECYSIYDSRDILGTLPEEYANVLGRAARWVGVSEEDMCRVIEKYERRLIRWGVVEKKARWRNENRTREGGTSSGDESEVLSRG